MDDIKITLTYAQADALVLAACCFADCAEGNLASVLDTWMPTHGPDQGAANEMQIHEARLALEGADVLRPELDSARKRDPEIQDALHRLKMFRKRLGSNESHS